MDGSSGEGSVLDYLCFLCIMGLVESVLLPKPGSVVELHSGYLSSDGQCRMGDHGGLLEKQMTKDHEDGFRAAVKLLRENQDRYGIGSMTSQWNADDVADDLLELKGLSLNENTKAKKEAGKGHREQGSKAR